MNLAQVDAATLKYELERAIVWKRKDKHGELVHTMPPDPVSADILAMPDYEQFPRLARVVTAPCVSATGHVINKPGFDAPSGIFYHQAEPLRIPDTNPTPEAVRQALSLIFDTWLADFPFADESSKAHALVLFLLPFARGLVDGVTPLHFVTAPSQRTGKSLLVEVLGNVFDPLISPGAAPEGRDNDAEWRKKIIATLQNESPHVWVDNIKGMIDSGALEAALTSQNWTDRALGSHRQVTLKNDKAWVFTGNNAELSVDLFGRAVEVRLDANLENPSERKNFKIRDIRRWTRQRRGELCAAALVIIRNWLENGKPAPAKGTPYLGGFEAWRQVMGGILAAAGVPGFLANRQATRERVNSEDDTYRAFVAAWGGVYGKNNIPMSAKELHQIANDAGLFEEALSAQSYDGEVRRLGRWLSKSEDRVFSSFKIRTGKTPSKGNKGYFLQQVNASSSGVSCTTQDQVMAGTRETRKSRESRESRESSNHAGFRVSPLVPPILPVSDATEPGNFSETPKNNINHQENNGICDFDGSLGVSETQDADMYLATVNGIRGIFPTGKVCESEQHWIRAVDDAAMLAGYTSHREMKKAGAKLPPNIEVIRVPANAYAESMEVDQP